MNKKLVPLSVPNISGNEWKYVKECLDTGWISSVGSFVTAFENSIASFTGAEFAIATVNGTSAMHICLQLLGVKPNDYVIIPNITFVATANVVKYMGADPILIDADLDTWQMDLDLLEDFLRNETKMLDGYRILKKDKRVIRLIMPVHVQGNVLNMEKLLEISTNYQISIFEDSTESLGTRYNGVSTGRFSSLGVFSFNGNKVISTGGGGMIITDNEEFAKMAKHLTTQAKSDSFEYIHDMVGYNYRLVNVLAAIGVAQMEQLPFFLERKKSITEKYYQDLSGIGDIEFQKILPQVETNNWLFTIKTKKQKELLNFLNKNNIQSRPFWRPMNMLNMFSNNIYVTKNDNSKKLYEECLSIPSSTNLLEEDLENVIMHIASFFKN